MIKIQNLIYNISNLLSEAVETETTGHMTHMGDWSIYGDAMLAQQHAEAMHKFMNGEATENHTVSVKADGGVSLVAGRKLDGRHFITYKSGKKMFHSAEEIDAAGVPWAEDGKRLLKHVMEMPIEHGHAFQGDLLWGHAGDKADGHVRPNTIHYKHTDHEIGYAVHSQYRIGHDDKLERVTNVPDIKQLEHSNVFVPNLQIKPGEIRLNAERNKAVAGHIERARQLMTPEVQKYAQDVSKNTKIHKFLQEYFNESVATTGHRSIESLKKYIQEPLMGAKTSYGYMEKSTQRKLKPQAQAQLIDDIHKHIDENREHIEALFNHMNELSHAKHHMLDQFNEHAHRMGIQPINSEHEGLVSAFGIPQKDGTIKNVSLAKLTREGIHGFSAKNRRRGVEKGFTKEREQPHPNVPFVDHTAEINDDQKKKKKKLKEEMSVGGGGIAGLGGPKDVAVPVEAQERYTKKGPMRRKRKIAENFLKRKNLMK